MAAQRPSIFACSSVRNASLPPPALRELPPSATAVTAQAVASARDPSPRACAVRRLGEWAIVLDVRDPQTGKRRRRWHSFRGTKREAQVECAKLIAEAQHGTA